MNWLRGKMLDGDQVATEIGRFVAMDRADSTPPSSWGFGREDVKLGQVLQ